VLEGDREVVVEAGGAAGVTVHRGPLERRTDLAQSIVRYVQRTRERVVLGDAGGSGQFPGDPYVAAARPRSILCVPVGPDTSAPVSSRSGGALSRPPPPSSGVLYLENNRIANAFGAERCRFVELCAAHAAVALRNARRFEALERRVEERSRELAKSDEAALSAERRLKEAQQQLLVQERLASLGQLTAGIVHEIKNPLNFVSNFAELSVALADEIEEGVRAGRLDGLDEALDDLRQNLSRIRDHGKRANDIIHGMLLHARAPTGGREEVDINALLANSVSLAYHGMRGRMRGFDVTVDAAYDPSIGPMKVASSELSQVFVNVIDNACYAMQKKAQAMDGAYAPRLTIRTKNLGEMAEVRIRDNGTGIPADVVGRIFRPFFTTKPTGEGTGLGLSVSHDIVVEGHHGEMRVESVPGEHTEFVIALPRRDRR
jgi:signal transduction histidine kinase